MTKLLFITFLLLGMMLPMNVSASPARPTVSVTDSAIPPEASVPVNVRLREDSVTGEIQRFVHIFYRDFDNITHQKIALNTHQANHLIICLFDKQAY